jgi:hypothetical protein
VHFKVDIGQRQRCRGRPTIRNTEIENEICYRIAHGESLRHICLDERMPCRDTVFRWLRNDRIRRLKLEAQLSAMRDQQQNKT